MKCSKNGERLTDKEFIKGYLISLAIATILGMAMIIYNYHTK